jgi:S-adenosylmethionine-dependent methyltransferase
MNEDHIFDGIADKFAKNIYGTTKGKLRHTLLCDVLDSHLPVNGSVLEIGGGTGVMAVHLASMGHSVVLTDASNDVLQQAKELLSHSNNYAISDNIEIRQEFLQDITDVKRFNFIICHAVLEWLDSPYEALSSIYNRMAPGAIMSLSFFNQDANLFANAIYGNFDYIDKGMKAKKQVRLNPKQPLSALKVLNYCDSLGFTVLDKAGIRCFHDYMRDISHQTTKYNDLLALERKYHRTEPYMWLGKYFQLILRK